MLLLFLLLAIEGCVRMGCCRLLIPFLPDTEARFMAAMVAGKHTDGFTWSQFESAARQVVHSQNHNDITP